MLDKEIQLSQLKSMNQIIYEYIKDKIITGEFVAETNLVERDLAEKFGTSRTPVRDALRRLEVEGFLVRKGKKELFVKKIDLENVHEAYLIRMALEPMLLKEITLNMAEDERNKMICFSEKDTKFCRNNNFINIDEIVKTFITLPKTQQILQSVYEDLRRFKQFNLSHSWRFESATLEHRQIFEAMIEKDATKVELLAKIHIQNSYEALKKCLKETKKNC